MLFLPQAFSDTMADKGAFKAVSLFSVLAMSGGMVATAIYAL